MIIGTSHKKDQVIIHKQEDVSQYAKVNEMLRKSDQNGFSKNRNYRNVANFSPLMWLKAVQKYPDLQPTADNPGDGKSVQRALRKALADPEFYWCKAVKGNI